MIDTTSKAPVTTSVALVSNSFFVATSKAPLSGFALHDSLKHRVLVLAPGQHVKERTTPLGLRDVPPETHMDTCE